MISVLSLAACIFAMTGQAFAAYAKMKKVYILGIAAGMCYTLLNAFLAFSGSDQIGVLLLIIPSAWLVGTSVLGLTRLRKTASSSSTTI